MPSCEWRVLRTGPADPAWNMAVDEALLETSAPGDAPVLRLYAWRPAALSLGRFQAAAGVEVPPGARLVRRITGGSAIHHREDEVTYAVIAPYALFGDRTPRAAYGAVHGAIARALQALGVALAPRTSAGAASAPPIGLCFANATDYDLVAGGKKLVGSAQRRRGHAFLQHGSLPVSPDPRVPSSTCLADLVPGAVPAAATIEEAIVAAFVERLGIVPRPAALTADEVSTAERLLATRYGADAWTHER